MEQTTTPPNTLDRLLLFFGMSAPLLVLLFLSRLVVDTGTRLVYPFIPQLASSIGVGVGGFGWLLFLRSWVGVAGPLFGMWADRYGRRRIMVAGLLALAAGALGVAFLPGWWASLPMLCWGLGMSAFIPAQQAYVNDVAPYARRGRALAAVDSAYAMAGIVALPLVGWLMVQVNWRAPLLLLSALCLLAAWVVRQRLPHVTHQAGDGGTLTGMGRALRSMRVLAALGVGFLLFVAYGVFVTVWSLWLSSDFGLDAVGIGLVATLIGLAELVGVTLSGLFIDRMGKRRGNLTGLLLLALCFVLLPWTQGNLPGARALLVTMGALWEFTIVSLLPLYAEQWPEGRATLYALVSLGFSLGLALASPIAVALWTWWGLGAASLLAMCALVAAAFLLWRWMQEFAHLH
jgi:predicted MFS family arabinose efflux permease